MRTLPPNKRGAARKIVRVGRLPIKIAGAIEKPFSTAHPELVEPASPRNRISEPVIERAIMSMLAGAKLVGTKTDAKRVFGFDGLPRKSVARDWPDLTYIGPDGRAILIEVKRSDGTTTQGQEETLLAAHESGALCMVARSADFVARRISAEYAGPAYDTDDPRPMTLIRFLRRYMPL